MLLSYNCTVRLYYLKARFNPVKLGTLEELGGFERLEEVSLLHILGRSVFEGIKNITLE